MDRQTLILLLVQELREHLWKLPHHKPFSLDPFLKPMIPFCLN
ncbi:MAG TPA: hypothetical protein VD886_00875 [Herpetosiphonaceae bacterium]|nr:hypothetical protein [Herpetosiphonaceae bacterium]